MVVVSPGGRRRGMIATPEAVRVELGWGHGMTSGSGSILAVDPGKTTGLAWCPVGWDGKTDADAAVGSEEVDCAGGTEYDPDPECSGVLRMLMRMRRVNAVVVVVEESDHFLLRAGGNLKPQSLVPIRLEAMLRFGLAQKWSSVKLERQTPSQAKSTITNDRLRRLGLWRSGSAHERDAIRHLVTYIRRQRSSISREVE